MSAFTGNEDKKHISSGDRCCNHGHVFRLNTLQLLLLRILNSSEIHNFSIGAEDKAAGKFDDIIIRIPKESTVSNYLLQLKHKDGQKATISRDDLFGEKKSDFQLKMYFISYMSLENSDKFKDGNKKVILYTNTDFSNLDKELKEIHDPILNINLLKFTPELFNTVEIKSKFVSYAKSYQVGKYLVEYLINGNELNCNIIEYLSCFQEKLKTYCHRTDHKTNTLEFFISLIIENKQEKNVDLKSLKFLENVQINKDIISLIVNDLKIAREAFIDIFNKNHDELLLKGILKENPEVTDKFSDEFCQLIKKNSRKKHSTDLTGINNKDFTGNIEKLIGHVIIYENNEFKFSESFINNTYFCKTLQKFREVVRSKIFKEALLKNARFQLDHKLECPEMFVTENLFWYQIKKLAKKINDSTAIPDIDETSKTAFEEFFANLHFAIAQPDQDAVSRLIHEEFANSRDFEGTNIDLAFFRQHINEWLSKKEGEYLNRHNIRQLIEQINYNKSIILSEEMKMNMERIFFDSLRVSKSIAFRNGDKRFVDFMNGKHRIVNIYNKSDVAMNALRVYQTLKNRKKNKIGFVCATSEEFCINNEKIISAVMSPTNTYFVFVLNTEMSLKHSLSVLEFLTEASKERKKIVLVTSELNAEFVNTIKTKYEKSSYTEHESIIEFKFLDENSRAHILNHDVNFQGHPIKLKDMSVDFVKDMNAEELSQMVIEQDPITVGKMIEVANMDTYIDRKLKRNSEEFEATSIHERTVLIVDEPGTGKTTFLKKLASVPENSDIKWKLYVNLNIVTSELKNAKFDTRESIEEFLLAVSKLETSLEKHYFQFCFQTSGKFVLMLDGVDEINPFHTDTVINFVKIFQEMTKHQVWISTRSHLKNKLEENLQVQSYTFCPFDDEMQNSFLKKYFRKTTENPEINDDDIDKFVMHMKSIYSSNMNDKKNTFLSTPLQLFMLASVLNEDFQKYCSNKNLSSIQPIDMLSLYEKFIEKKFQIYFNEKNLVQTGIASMNIIKKKLFKTYMIDHEYLALFYLFPKIKKMISFTEYEKREFKETLEEIKTGENNTGLVIKDPDLRIDYYFIHTTFAEYFAAKYLARNSTERHIRDFIKGRMFAEDFQVVRKFLDRFINKDIELHMAIINSDVKKVDILLNKHNTGSLFEIKDKLGRTPLHLLAMYYETNICCKLLKYKPSINVKDELFRLTPVEYLLKYASKRKDVFRINNLEMLEELIKHNFSVNTHYMLQKITFTGSNNSNLHLLHVISALGYINTLKYLLTGRDSKSSNMIDKHCLTFAIKFNQYPTADILFEKNKNLSVQEILLCDIVADNNIKAMEYLKRKGLRVDAPEHKTVLHSAAKHGHLGMVKLLIENGANIYSKTNKGQTPLQSAFDLTVTYGFKIKYSTNRQKEANRFEVFQLLREKAIEDQQYNIKVDYHALFRAIYWNQLFATQYLLKNSKVNVNLRKIYHHIYGTMTAFHAACDVGNFEIVKFFLENQATFDNGTKNGYKPLDIAICRENSVIIKLLKEHAAKQINTVKTISSRREYFQNTLYKNFNNYQFCYAAQTHNVIMMHYYMKNGVDVNFQDQTGKNILHYAVINRDCDVVKLLISKGAHVNSTDKKKRTPLYCAASARNLNCVKALVENNADVNLHDDKKRTPLIVAANLKDEDVVEYLLKQKHKDWSLVAEVFSNEKYSSDFFQNSYVTLCIVALRASNDDLLEICKEVLTKIELDVKKKLFIHAVLKGSMKMLKFLVENANIDNLKPFLKSDVLQIAKKHTFLEIINFIENWNPVQENSRYWRNRVFDYFVKST